MMRALTLFIIITLASCAKQTAPTGGPKDETPPKLVESNPKKNAINFKEKEIVLTFDEYIQLNNPREQIIITPSIGKKFEATVKKNTLTLKLNTTLSDSTTYSFNFREAVQDITEKNPAANLKFAISTGNFIDSLSIKGIVTDLLTEAPCKDYTVGLAIASDTFNIFKHPVQWLAMTDKEGKFSLENLKPGTYILTAFNDKNKDLKIDSKSEAYAYQSAPITISSNQENINLKTIKLDARPFSMVSAKPLSNYYNIKTSKSITSYNITSEQVQLYHKKADETNIKIFSTNLPGDSLQVKLAMLDSIGNNIDTTLYIRFDQRPSLAKDKFTASILSPAYTTNNNTLTYAINFTKPVQSVTIDSVYIQVDSTNRLSLQTEQITWDYSRTKATVKLSPAVQLQKPTPSNTAVNLLYLGKASFISCENDTLMPVKQTIPVITPEDSGIIFVTVQADGPFIVQLLDSKMNLISEYANIKIGKFDNLTPANYNLRLVKDSNGNGKWDPGNYYLRQMPEEVIFYKNEKGDKNIILKANWEIGPLLITF